MRLSKMLPNLLTAATLVTGSLSPRPLLAQDDGFKDSGNQINCRFIHELFAAAARSDFNAPGDALVFTDDAGKRWQTEFKAIIYLKLGDTELVGAGNKKYPATMTCLGYGTPTQVGTKNVSPNTINSVCISGMRLPTAPDSSTIGDNADHNWQIYLQRVSEISMSSGGSITIGHNANSAEISNTGKSGQEICYSLSFSFLGDQSASAHADYRLLADEKTTTGTPEPLCFKQYGSPVHNSYRAG